MVLAIQCTDLFFTLLLFIASGYSVYFINKQNTLLSLLFLVFLCIIDLMFRSPLIVLQTPSFKTANSKGESDFFKRSVHLYKKAIRLRFRLWVIRTVLYTLLFIPSAVLISSADAFNFSVTNNITIEALALVSRIMAVVFFVGGMFFVEVFMLRYWLTWCILSNHISVKQAIAASKILSKGENSTLFSLYMRFGLQKPRFFKECMTLVTTRSASMKHMHILNENAKTVKGREKRPEKHFKLRRNKTMNNQNNQNNQNQKNQQNNQNNQNNQNQNNQNRKQF